MSAGAIVGSAFGAEGLGEATLEAIAVETPYGPHTLHQVRLGQEALGWVSARHGLPHRLLPHQVNWRAQAWALREVGCQGVLVTSSVGVLDGAVPLYQPLTVADLIMLDNRLPDGSPCTMFLEPSSTQGHLVLAEGLVSAALTEQLRQLAAASGWPVAGEVVFGYVAGPRTKTRAENRLWAQLGAQVNSMTLAPELVLLNELEVPCAALAVGHKYSLPGLGGPDEATVAASLVASRGALEALVLAFLREATPVAFGNAIFRFEAQAHGGG